MNELADTTDERLQDLIRACLLPNTDRISLDQMIAVLEGNADPPVTPSFIEVKQRHARMLERYYQLHGQPKPKPEKETDWAKWGDQPDSDEEAT